MSARFTALVPLAICPVAPPGAQVLVDQISGYIVWGVLILFVVGTAVAVASIVAGRVFHSPHASKAGVVGLLVIVIAAVLYVVAPTIVTSITGSGCIG